MPHVQCHFCSTSNPADATVCSACGKPLAKGELVETSAEPASEAVPTGNPVVALEAPPRVRNPNAPRFGRRLIGVITGAGLLVALGMLIYDPSNGPVQPTSPTDSTVSSESAAPTDSGASAERARAVQAEPAAAPPSSEPPPRAATAERDSNTLSLMEGMRRAAARGESAAASQPVEPAPRAPAIRSTVAGGASAGSVPGGGAATANKKPAACTDAVAALGLCPSEPAPAQSATRVGPSPEVAQPPAKNDASRACNDAAAALGLCVQITTRGN
jgi:hypothetical protein